MDRWQRSPPGIRLGIIVGSVAVLYFAKPVLLPLAFALLLSVVIWPVVRRLERVGLGRLRIGRIGAVLIVAVAVAGAFGGMGWIVGVQGGALAEKWPEYRSNTIARLREPLDSWRRLERTAREVREMAEAPNQGPRPSQVEVVGSNAGLVSLAGSWVGSLASLLGTSGLVIVLLVFLLVEREGLRDRVLRVVAPSDLRVTTSAFGEAVERVTRYLRAFALLNLAHGAAVALGLWVIGLPGALLLGLLASTLRFIPYLGPWLAATLAIIVGVASSESWTVPLVVAIYLVALELISNNLLEPWLYGTNVGLSPFAVILSAIFWGWLWGPIGLVLATPITACLVSFGRYTPSLEPLAILLSDAQALPPADRFYQRLLASLVHEATEIVAERTKALDALAAWDEVVLPALGLLERDRQEQRLDPEQLAAARETLESLLAELPEPEIATEKTLEAPALCIPARSGWDETVCLALARFLEAHGVPARAIGHQTNAELAAEVGRSGAACICVSSLANPIGTAQHLLLRIRKLCPEVKIIVGLWGLDSDPTLHQRLGVDDLTQVVSRLAEAREMCADQLPALRRPPAVSSNAAKPIPRASVEAGSGTVKTSPPRSRM